MSVGSVSLAGGGLLDQVIDATEQANTMANDAKATTDSVEQKSIEAQNASTQESGDIVDQTKDAVKKSVNETVNETIDNLGK